MKWGVGGSGREKEEVYIILVSLLQTLKLLFNAPLTTKTDNFWVVCATCTKCYMYFPLLSPSPFFFNVSYVACHPHTAPRDVQHVCVCVCMCVCVCACIKVLMLPTSVSDPPPDTLCMKGVYGIRIILLCLTSCISMCVCT